MVYLRFVSNLKHFSFEVKLKDTFQERDSLNERNIYLLFKFNI